MHSFSPKYFTVIEEKSAKCISKVENGCYSLTAHFELSRIAWRQPSNRRIRVEWSHDLVIMPPPFPTMRSRIQSTSTVGMYFILHLVLLAAIVHSEDLCSQSAYDEYLDLYPIKYGNNREEYKQCAILDCFTLQVLQGEL